MDTESLHALIAHYFDAINAGDSDKLFGFYDPNVVQEEFPNRLIPQGMTRNLAALGEAAQKGSKLLIKQHFEVLNVTAEGNRVAVEAIWTATLALPVGSIPAGGDMRARMAVFFEIHQGKIVRQHNYDCFDPF